MITNSSILSVFCRQVQGGTVGAGVTTYNSLAGTGGFAAYSSEDMIVSVAGEFSTFYILTTTAQPSTGALTINVKRNNTLTSLVITIPAGAAAGTYSNTTNSFTINPGDTVVCEFINSASSASASVRSYSMIMRPGSTM